MPQKIYDFNKALQYCFLLLKYRKRSEAELVARLKLKKCPQSVLEKTVAYLKESNLIPEDASFAGEWAEYKLSAGYGINRIAADLFKRRVGRDAIEQLRETFKREKREEVRRVLEGLIAKRIKGSSIGYEQKQKLVRFLLQRGFLIDEVLEVLDDYTGS